MYIKNYTKTMVVLVVCMIFTSMTKATILYDFQANVGNWNVSGNWKANGAASTNLPGTLDYAVVASNTTCTLDTTTTVNRLRIGEDSNGSLCPGSGILNVGTGYSVTATSEMDVGDNDRSDVGYTGTLNQTGGSVITSGSAALYIGNRGADGFYNISGGSLSVGGRMYIGSTNYDGTAGTLNITGADATITMDVLEVRENATIKFVFDDDQGISTLTAASWARINSNATLVVEVDSGAAFATGDVFTLIDGGANLVDQFGNYADGDIIQINNMDMFRVNYDVDNNNLLTLTALHSVPMGTVITIQ